MIDPTPSKRQARHAWRWSYTLASLVMCMLLGLVACGSGSDVAGPSTQVLPSQLSSSASPPAPTKPPPPEGWESGWLKGVPCAPPCWEGITPGRTSASEAVEILQRSPLISTVDMGPDSLLPKLGSVTWNWADGQAGGEADYPAQTITQTIDLVHPHLSTSFKLRDVIDAYGQPSLILATAGHGPDIGSPISYDVTFVYLDRGFMLAQGGDTKPDINPDLPLVGLTLFAPGREGFAAAMGAPAMGAPFERLEKFLLPWQGMKDFDFYCRDISEGRDCRGE